MLQANVFLKDFQKKYSYSIFDDRKSNCPLPQAGGVLTLNLICPLNKKKVRGNRISGFPALCRDGAFRGCRRV